MKRYLVILLLILQVGFLNASAPESFWGTGVLSGRIIDEEGLPLDGAGVVLMELNMGVVAGNDGDFLFRNLRNGMYTIQVSHVGFASEHRSVELKNGFSDVVIVMKSTHIELREVIVQESATGMVQADKSLSVTVANRDFFSGSTTMTTLQSLQRIPGINSMDIGTGISKPVIRGLGFNRMVVAQNNIKQQGQQWGNDHGLEIDGYAVERVEIVKGPSSLVFGSDAIGGVLNIRPPVVPQENSVEIQAIAVGHSNNDMAGGSFMTATNRDGKFFRVRISKQSYGDYRVPASEFVYNNWIMPIGNKRLKNTSGNDLGFSAMTGIRKSWGITTLSVSNFQQEAGFFPASHGIPNPTSLLITGDPRKTDFPMQKVNHFSLASNTNLLLGKGRVELDLGFQQNHRQELNPPHRDGAGPLPNTNVELKLILNTFSLNLKYHRRFSASQALLLGFSSTLQDNTRGGYNFLLPDFVQGDGGLFGIYTHNLNDKITLNGGLRVDATQLSVSSYHEPVWIDENTVDGFTERATDLERKYLNATISSGLSWNPSDVFNFKLNIGSGYRNPTPIELSANGIHHGSFRHEMGDTALMPERALQFDIAIVYQVKEFYLHISPFANYFSNFLYLNPSGLFSPLPTAGQIYRFQQAPALHMGGELYADWHITHALHTSMGAEWVWAQNTTNNYPLPFTPPASVVTEINYNLWSDKDGVELSLVSSARLVAAQNRVARNEPSTAGYTLVNMGVNTKIKAGDFPIEIIFMVNNLFDTLYKNHISFYRILELPEPGRNFTLKIIARMQRWEN